MVIFKCSYCRTEYEMTRARLSFNQRSYAKCQICNQTMYSWNSRNVPIFTLMNASKGETPDIQPVTHRGAFTQRGTTPSSTRLRAIAAKSSRSISGSGSCTSVLSVAGPGGRTVPRRNNLISAGTSSDTAFAVGCRERRYTRVQPQVTACHLNRRRPQAVVRHHGVNPRTGKVLGTAPKQERPRP